MDNLNKVLDFATKHTTTDKKDIKPLSKADQEFLKGALDQVKSHNDVVKDIQTKMDMDIEDDDVYDDLEEWAYDIDVAYAMAAFGVFRKIKESKFSSKRWLQIGAICSQNNEKVQKLAGTEFLTELLVHLENKVASLSCLFSTSEKFFSLKKATHLA